VSSGLTALTLVVYALAVARTTRLVVADKLTEGPRKWLVGKVKGLYWRRFIRLAEELTEIVNEEARAGHLDDALEERRRWLESELEAEGKAAEKRQKDSKLVYLVTCPWCVSIWMSLPAVIVWWNWPTEWWSFGPAILLAFSQVTGELAERVSALDDGEG